MRRGYRDGMLMRSSSLLLSVESKVIVAQRTEDVQRDVKRVAFAITRQGNRLFIAKKRSTIPDVWQCCVA